MSELLKLPELLSGHWDHLLIMTYGADLAFFEHAIWRALPARCKNKIILADGTHYLRAYQDNERNGLARHLNEKYVFDGIFTAHAAHAKFILLTAPERGHLLVGSGNLSLQGYASGGEMFTLYDYSPQAAETLPAFLAVRAFLDNLIDRGAFRPVTVQHLNHLFVKTPWLYHATLSEWRPVRDNLNVSFLDQLREIVSGEPVEKLWVLSPFYDPAAYALDHLLDTFAPKEAHLLVQPGLTSVWPEALQTVFNRHAEQTQVHVFSLPGELAKTYVHTKLYLLETATRSICLQGSPNLSQAAMLRSFADGNLELANLLIDRPKVFEPLFQYLEIQPATLDLSSLDLTFQQEDDRLPGKDGSELTLLGADWNGSHLTCFVIGQIAGEMQIRIGDQIFSPVKIISQSTDQVTIAMPPEAIPWLEKGLAVSVKQPGNETNPVYVWQRGKLKDLLNIQETNVSWDSVGSFDLEDEILEQLLLDLDANLVIDRRSVWQVANRTVPRQAEADDEVLRLDYADIDYEQLRRHPKIRQYNQDKTSFGTPYDRSALQILFSSILENFGDLANLKTGSLLIPPIELSEVDTVVAETEEEQEAQAVEKQRRRLAVAKRVRRILQNFVKRYIQGLRSPDFQEFAGTDVMVKNYVIFSHILWRLFYRDELENDFVLESLLQIWYLFWGQPERSGVYERFTDEMRSKAAAFMLDHKSEARLLSSIYYGSKLTILPSYRTRRLALRDFVRYFFTTDYWVPITDILEDTWIYIGNLLAYNPPTPGQIVTEISSLAGFETSETFLHSLEKSLGAAENACRFSHPKPIIHLVGLGRKAPVDELQINDSKVTLTKETAISIIQQWNQFQPKDYFRIVSHDRKVLVWYETRLKMGLFHVTGEGEPEEIGELPSPADHPWEKTLQQLKDLAYIVEKRISLGFVEKNTQIAMEIHEG